MNQDQINERARIAKLINEAIAEHLAAAFNLSDNVDRLCISYDIVDMLIKEGIFSL